MLGRFFRGIRLSVLDFLDSSIISIKFSASQNVQQHKKIVHLTRGSNKGEAALNIGQDKSPGLRNKQPVLLLLQEV